MGRTRILQEQKKPEQSSVSLWRDVTWAFQKILTLIKVYTPILNVDLAVTFVARAQWGPYHWPAEVSSMVNNMENFLAFS